MKTSGSVCLLSDTDTAEVERFLSSGSLYNQPGRIMSGCSHNHYLKASSSIICFPATLFIHFFH